MRAVKRALQVLEILAEADQGVRLTDICRSTGLDGSTALRYLNTLLAAGYAAHDLGDRTRYRVGHMLARLSGSSEIALLQRVARPHMVTLRDVCGEDVNLGTMDADSALCLETKKSSHILGANIADGLRVSAQASSLGKAILAFLPEESRRAITSSIRFKKLTPNTIGSADILERELTEIRRRGYSVDREEFTLGVVCIGAPVFNGQGRVMGALSITAPVQRLSLSQLEARYARLLLEACSSVSAGLGFAAGEERCSPSSNS